MTGGFFWADVSERMTFGLPIEGDVAIQGKTFRYSNKDSSRAFTIEGTFDSETYAHGTIFFPKGYTMDLYTQPEDVTIEWTAHPIQ